MLSYKREREGGGEERDEDSHMRNRCDDVLLHSLIIVLDYDEYTSEKSITFQERSIRQITAKIIFGEVI